MAESTVPELASCDLKGKKNVILGVKYVRTKVQNRQAISVTHGKHSRKKMTLIYDCLERKLEAEGMRNRKNRDTFHCKDCSREYSIVLLDLDPLLSQDDHCIIVATDEIRSSVLLRCLIWTLEAMKMQRQEH